MTKGKLFELLKDKPDSMPVFLDKRFTTHDRGSVNSVRVEEVIFYEEEDPDNKSTQTKMQCIVLSERIEQKKQYTF